ncbi:hypothetical protein B296_00003991, partial [Ensete ventricosum]
MDELPVSGGSTGTAQVFGWLNCPGWGLVLTQRRSIVDAGVPQEGGLGSGH